MVVITLLKITLFIHVICTATLFGGLSLLVIFLRDASKSTHIDTMIDRAQKVQHWNKAMMVPISALALLTGVYMMLQYSTKPLWLMVKERFGGLLLLLFILFVATHGKKLVAKAAQEKDIAIVKSILNRYILILNGIVLCMIILIFAVTFKI